MSGFSLDVTKGVSLRLVEPRHAEEMFAVIDRSREHIGAWMPWPERTRSVEDSRAYGQRSLEEFAQRTQLALSILVDGNIVGGTGWTDWKQETDAIGVDFASADIGYWIAHDFEGRGIVTQAVGRVVEFAIADHGLKRLTIRAEPENTRSWKVAERLGFTREGTMRSVCKFNGRWIDHHLYSLLDTEWGAGRA